MQQHDAHICAIVIEAPVAKFSTCVEVVMAATRAYLVAQTLFRRTSIWRPAYPPVALSLLSSVIIFHRQLFAVSILAHSDAGDHVLSIVDTDLDPISTISNLRH